MGKELRQIKMDRLNNSLNWIKTHRFWTSVIALWSLHLILSLVPLNLLDMGGIPEFILSSQFLGYYTFIGGITWSFRQKKDGYTLLAIGIVLLLLAFNILIKFYVYIDAGLQPYTNASNYIMLSIALACGTAGLYFGKRRYTRLACSRNKNDEG
jgi:hypothetical protein